MSLGRVEFGGPDLQPRRLRNLLQSYVDASPPGSRIDWMTYYFRDRALAESLMRASDRGVAVQLVLEEHPRQPRANDAVIAMLRQHGLGGGLHVSSSRGGRGEKGHIHAKIYAFSHPDIGWIGSFNPSGDEPEDPDVIAEIGDQDRGHNLLIGIERPKLTRALRGMVDRMATIESKWLRYMSWLPATDGDTRLYFYPRLRNLVVEPTIALLGRGAHIRGAISHLKKGPLTWALARCARRGGKVDLLVHDTTRRVSEKAIQILSEAGAAVRRVAHPNDLPMHAKFLLIEGGGRRTSWVGSYNFNDKSRFDNVELLVGSGDAHLFDALAGRFTQIKTMAATTAA